MSHLNEIPWNEELLTKRIEESFYFGQHLTTCMKTDSTLFFVSIFDKLALFQNGYAIHLLRISTLINNGLISRNSREIPIQIIKYYNKLFVN